MTDIIRCIGIALIIVSYIIILRVSAAEGRRAQKIIVRKENLTGKGIQEDHEILR